MNRNHMVVGALAALVLAAPQIASAAEVVRPLVLTDPVEAGDGSSIVTFNFAPVVAADEVISFSEGFVDNSEGNRGFSILVDYVDGTSAQIFAQPPSDDSLDFELANLSHLAFAKGDVDGLTFNLSPQTHISVWTEAQVTFHVADVTQPPGGPVGGVPEPASWALMIMGFGAVGSAMRAQRTAALRRA